jgi:hypothetical protein
MFKMADLRGTMITIETSDYELIKSADARMCKGALHPISLFGSQYYPTGMRINQLPGLGGVTAVIHLSEVISTQSRQVSGDINSRGSLKDYSDEEIFQEAARRTLPLREQQLSAGQTQTELRTRLRDWLEDTTWLLPERVQAAAIASIKSVFPEVTSGGCFVTNDPHCQLVFEEDISALINDVPLLPLGEPSAASEEPATHIRFPMPSCKTFSRERVQEGIAALKERSKGYYPLVVWNAYNREDVGELGDNSEPDLVEAIEKALGEPPELPMGESPQEARSPNADLLDALTEALANADSELAKPIDCLGNELVPPEALEGPLVFDYAAINARIKK